MAEAKLLAEEIVKALDSKRAKEIEVLHVGDITILADYFILCTATSTTQIRTLADLCEERAEQLGEELHHREGERESGWVLLDFSTVVVHIFLPEQREFYSLDRLWRDGETVDISGLLEDAREQRRQELEQNALIKKGKYRSGIFFEDQHRRIKPYGLLASRTIGGIYGKGGGGNSGLEKRFDKELRGEDGLSSIQKIGGRYESVTIDEAKDGLDVVTTIDANLQDIVENALLERTALRGAKWGCCILMETQTGFIRAIANLDRSATDGHYFEAQNHAVQRVEPGSTFKTIALMAALDDGKIDIDDTVSVTRQPWKYFTVKHRDAHPMDTLLTVRSALAVSSNIALAKLITRSYEGSANKFVRKIEKMGLMDSVYCEIPGADKVRIDVPKDTVTLSKMAYGYSVELSPMQILMFYNAIANGGRMMRPMLVTAIQQNGEIEKRFRPEVVKSSICGSRTLKDIQGALHDVVWDNHLGTAAKKAWIGNKAQSNLVSIAGKTGTAQLIIPGHGYSGRHHRMTFVGYFPEENPRYTCICMIEDPQYPYDAGLDCGTTVRVIAEKTMAYTGCYVYRNGERVLDKR